MPNSASSPARVTAAKRVPAGGHPLLEHIQIQLARLDAQQVPRRPGQHPGPAAAGDNLAQPGDLHPQHPLRRPGGLVAEQLLNQLVAGDHPVGVTQQQRQQRPLPRPAHRHQRSAEPHLQRPQDPEHQATVHGHPRQQYPLKRPAVASSRG